MRFIILSVLFCLTFGACVDQDPFGLSRRQIAGSIHLEQWEDFERYYLVGPEQLNGGGLLEGTVQQIGWNDRYVLAFRYSTFRGDPDGWMIVDSRSGTIKGPFADAELAQHPGIQGIDPVAPSVAWQLLGGW